MFWHFRYHTLIKKDSNSLDLNISWKVWKFVILIIFKRAAVKDGGRFFFNWPWFIFSVLTSKPFVGFSFYEKRFMGCEISHKFYNLSFAQPLTVLYQNWFKLSILSQERTFPYHLSRLFCYSGKQMTNFKSNENCMVRKQTIYKFEV